ncbi:hypothetical protein HELRODRAFT_192239 [Helobdella robusta]|uniref:C-type lectin domain-containing protein n=1 Tax=Helobdella robusta TaxID=6412 RepID=T1FTR1_HELRO|nr:hypothetical protein HELRODRAFT_192239 [Helobdella robusta]ESO01712.1 hypothetical protein HELRODRAFT_192239 [Helobdella robusta]
MFRQVYFVRRIFIPHCIEAWKRLHLFKAFESGFFGKHVINCCLLDRNKKLPVCFDDQMPITKKTQARSLKECILKCMLLTDEKLRGMNYMPSGSCSCFSIASLRYNVSTKLVASGCRSYVNHDCPERFDYVVEQHRCYKMQFQLLNWYDARSLCNSISHSHPISIDDDQENVESLEYVNITAPNYQVCPITGFTDIYAFYTSGISTYFSGVRTPFLWFPYPGIYKNVQSTSAWHSSEPNSIADGSDNCIQSILLGYFGWNDAPCTWLMCVLCEFDMKI